MKSNKGFSLVELIVVIAIMAIIAGVAIPVYSNYITKANDSNGTQQVADLVYAAKLANAEYETEATYAFATGNASITLTFTGDKAEAAADQVAKIVGTTTTDETVTVTFKKALSTDAVAAITGTDGVLNGWALTA